LGEEIVNCISHGVGLLAALGAVPVLMLGALRRGDAADIVGASIFAATVVMLYLASTLYHALPSGRAKDVFRLLDHGAIYLLIAGTYTPFTLGVMRGAWGWTLFGIVWSLAVMGIVLRATGAMKHPWLSTLLYIRRRASSLSLATSDRNDRIRQ
jgi:hemolysin III